MKQLILVGLLIASSTTFADLFDSQSSYQREMLKQQQEQTRIMQIQQEMQIEALNQQKYSFNGQQRRPYNDNFY